MKALNYEEKNVTSESFIAVGEFGFISQHNITITVLDSNDMPLVLITFEKYNPFIQTHQFALSIVFALFISPGHIG